MLKSGTVKLDEKDWQIIDAADTNDAGRSATLRRIVREWHALHQAMQPVHAQPRTLVDTKEEYHERG